MRVRPLVVNKRAAGNEYYCMLYSLFFQIFQLFSLSYPPFLYSFFSFVIIISYLPINSFSFSIFLSLPRSFLTAEDKENMFTLDHFPVWYRRATEYPVGQFLYYMPRQETRGSGHTFTNIHAHTHGHKTHFLCFSFFQFSKPCSAG